MNSDLPSRVRDLFQASLAHSPPTRKEFLREACGDDRALFDEVAQLLYLYQHVEDEDQHATPDDLLGARVGAYEITRLIGSGGMGRVYLARRADGAFTRDVAIKVIHPDALDDAVVARFDQECRILASLHHSCIAQLFDAGRTATDQLYLVMEYVDGVPITVFSDRRGLSLRDRIALLDRVCDGVSEAHRKLIVHRDLKPGNILVDASGTPKLVDFGIAKAITPVGLEASDPTHPFEKRATPAYASPEQIHGETAQTGMDIFSLGVVLHELLTGQRPWKLPHDATTTISAAGFLKPSAGLSRVRGATDSGTGPADVRAGDLAGDLDAIVLKALHSDPRRRYRSVESLSADLQAYLNDRPVDARQNSISDQVVKFTRRNPTLVAALTFAALALLLATGSLARLWFVAARDRDQASEQLGHLRKLAESAFGLDRTLADLPGATTSRRLLAEALSTYLSGVRLGRDRALALDTAESYRRLGDIQGNPNGPNLGEPTQAVASYESALAILEPLHGAQSDTASLTRLATTHAALGDVMASQRSLDAARIHYATALSLADELSRSDGDEGARRVLLAGIYRPLGDLKLATGDVTGAVEEFDKALAIDTANVDRFPADPEYRRLLALTHFRVAAAYIAQGKFNEARAGFQRAEDILNELAARGYRRSGLERDVALARSRLGVVLEAEGDKTGRAEIGKATNELRSLAAVDPADARARHDLVAVLVQLADTVRADDPASARTAYRQARDVAVTLIGPDGAASGDIALINRRLADTATGSLPADLRLFKVVDGKRLLLQAGDAPPKISTQMIAVARVSPGWSRYLLIFGADGPAQLLEQRDPSQPDWMLSLEGPPPAETILLVAFPRALTEQHKQELLRDVNAIQGPRTVDWDSQIVWSLAEDAIESTVTARGSGDIRWVRSIRERIGKFGPASLSGRTFPLAPRGR